MAASYGIGLVTLVGVLLFWVGVQRAWGRVFPDAEPGAEPDVLARRGGCHACGDCDSPAASATNQEEP